MSDDERTGCGCVQSNEQRTTLPQRQRGQVLCGVYRIQGKVEMDAKAEMKEARCIALPVRYHEALSYDFSLGQYE